MLIIDINEQLHGPAPFEGASATSRRLASPSARDNDWLSLWSTSFI